MAVYSVDKLISQARRLAADYRRATGKSLAGVSIEIARSDAARLLGLELVDDPALGYDALDADGRRIQIKGRAIFDEGKSGQRIGQLRLDKDWDRLLLVLLDEDYEPYEIHEATRADIDQAVADAQGKRSRRGALSVARFRHLARLVWTCEEGVIEDEIWENHPEGANGISR